MTLSAKESPKEPLREWTFLIYSAGDEGSKEKNSPFSKTSVHVIKELEGIELPEKVRDQIALVLQYDGPGDDTKQKSHNREWRRLLQFIPPENSSNKWIDSPGIPEAEIQKFDPSFVYDEQDSGDPVTLKKFIKWGVAAYPAKHYVLVFQGHSWGVQGLAQDAHREGKDFEVFTLIKNYEIRRILEEVYAEDHALPKEDRKIPKGKFDLFLLDACTSGNLDVLLEFKDVFSYFVGSSSETPFQGFPYPEVLGNFFKAVALVQSEATHDAEAEAEKDLIEEKLLKPLIVGFAKSHGPHGYLTKDEGQLDTVEAFAIRNEALTGVADALKRFIAAMPEEAKTELHQGRPSSVWRLRDMDENADLLQLAVNFRIEFENTAKKTGLKIWEEAAKAALALQNSLGYHAANPSLEPTEIKHPTAIGAWVHAEIDPYAYNRDIAVCQAIKAYTMLNADKKQFLVKKIKDTVTGKKIDLAPLNCNDVEKALKKKKLLVIPPLDFENPIAIENILKMELIWAQGIPAYVTDFSHGTDDGVNKRLLSLWIPKPKRGPLNTTLLLKLASTQNIDIDYVSENPEGFLKKEKGYEEWLLSKAHVDVTPLVIITDAKELEISTGKPGPYVAEAHSHGTLFKHGFGLFLGLDLSDREYNWGQLPLETVERLLGMKPYSLTIEKYGLEFKEIESALKKVGVPLAMKKGSDFYRFHRIESTGWPSLLFGAKGRDDKP